MPHAMLAAHRLYYEETGRKDGPVLVLLNGLTMSTAAWSLMLPALEARYRLIRLDFVGQGQSDKPEAPFYPLDRQAADLAALLDWRGIGRCHMAGLSYGGLVAQHFARDFGQRLKRLLLAATFARSGAVNAALGTAWQAVQTAGGAALRQQVSLPWFFSDTFLTEQAVRLPELARVAAEVDWPACLRLMEGASRHDARSWLGQVRCPVRVVVGSADRLTPPYEAEALVTALPDAHLEIVPGAGHALHLEAPAALARAIIEHCTD
ncbi:alpha/beta fold hydrolase [Gulbenkiania mobilis]|uniref:alpha/beta fold hydrolase n=1 Tax=Gulbenkiania mobilis TaxID=397457 RepID=UPI0006BBF4BF|nr:alpha/beta fold hydrolase [Gulbenkiania mobilis]